MSGQITVAQALVGFMQRLGIGHVFGMPGAHILPVYDALYDSAIRAVLAKHEQGAAFMAGGLARATGGVGACIATAGPGATNLVTGIANAYADRLPVLAITGETSTYIFGRGGLQESSGEGGSVDQVALFAPITRYSRLIERTDYLENVLRQAARALLAEVPGPVLLALPFNVQKETVDAGLLARLPTRAHARAPGAQVKALVDYLLQAERPVIVAGHGCLRAGAQPELAQLAETLSIPVATSLKAKGALDEASPLALGSLGVTSSGQAYRYIADQADLVLFLGASFNERTSYLWDANLLDGKTVIQVDIDPARLEKVFRADLAVCGDIKAVLAEVLACLPAQPGASARRAALAAAIGAARHGEGQGYAMFQSGFALVEHFFRGLEARFPAGIQVFDDNIIFAQNFYRVGRDNRYYPNTGISALGHAIPAAIGARLAKPQPTFAILGDGGFQMCAMELMTAVNYGVPLNVVVFANATMGLIRKNQQQQYGGRFISCDFVNPDLARLAESFGIAYHRLSQAAEVEALFATADLTGAINLIEIVLDKNLFPNYSSRR